MKIKNVLSTSAKLLVVLLSGGNKDLEMGLQVCQEIQLPYLRDLLWQSVLLIRQKAWH